MEFLTLSYEAIVALVLPVIILLLNMFKYWRDMRDTMKAMDKLSALERTWVKDFTKTLIHVMTNDLHNLSPSIRREFMLISMNDLEFKAHELSNGMDAIKETAKQKDDVRNG